MGSECYYLDVGDYVCMGLLNSTLTTTATAIATTIGTSISMPLPIQTGMVSDYDEFYLVQSGDSCRVILGQYDITLDKFYSWNSVVGTSC